MKAPWLPLRILEMLIVPKQRHSMCFSTPSPFSTNHRCCFERDLPVSRIIRYCCFTLLGVVINMDSVGCSPNGTNVQADVCAMLRRCTILFFDHALILDISFSHKMQSDPIIHSSSFQPLDLAARTYLRGVEGFGFLGQLVGYS